MQWILDILIKKDNIQIFIDVVSYFSGLRQCCGLWFCATQGKGHSGLGLDANGIGIFTDTATYLLGWQQCCRLWSWDYQVGDFGFWVRVRSKWHVNLYWYCSLSFRLATVLWIMIVGHSGLWKSFLIIQLIFQVGNCVVDYD